MNTRPEPTCSSETEASRKRVGKFLSVLLLVVGCWGCGPRGGDEAALDSDANGYACLDCNARFYTDRKIFPNHCPGCKKANIEIVLGYVCATDQQVQYGPRGKSGMKCQACGKSTTSIAIPRQAELQAWGATRSTGPDVGVH